MSAMKHVLGQQKLTEEEMESLPLTMKALLKSEPQSSYVLVDLPVPRPQKGQSLLKIGRRKNLL